VSLPDAAGTRRMMAADIASGPPVRIGQPRVLFPFSESDLAFAGVPVRGYEVAPDGRHFYVVRTPTPPPSPAVTHINLITNWFDELKAKVPLAR